MKQKLTAFVYFILSNFVLVAQQDSTVSTLIDMSLKDLMNIPISGHSRYKQSLDEVSSSIIVLTNHQIKERGYSDLSDLLKDVPGFDITDNAGRFGEFYSIRGIAGNDRFLVLIDGHKLNPPSGTFLSVGNSINICKAVRVEIIFGPASAIYGADAFSGIINIVFIDDNEDVDEAENGSKNISATLNYGSFNSINVALQSIVKFTDDLSFQICARQYTSEGFSVVGSDTLYDFVGTYADILEDVDIQKINDHNIYTYLRYRNFSLNYYRQQFDEGNAMGLNPQIYIYSAENKWKTTTDMWWIDYKKEFENGGNLNFDISYLVHLQDKNSLFYKWLIPGITVDTYKQFMTGKDKALRSEISYNQVFSDKFQFIVGLDFESTSSIPPYANDEILGESSIYEGNNATIINDNLSIKENRFAGFGQFTFSPWDFFDFTMGLRADYSTAYKSIFNPRFGAIIRPWEGMKLKLNYGTAYQAPSLFHQYEQFGTATVAMLSTAEINRNNSTWMLSPQMITSRDIGFSQIFFSNLEFSALVYYNKLENLIERKLYAVYPTDSVYNKYFDIYTSGLRNENIGLQKIVGSEISLKAKVFKRSIIQVYYSYTNAVSIDSDDNESFVPRISMHKFWSTITIHDLFELLTFSARFKLIGDMYNSNTAIFADNMQDGYSNLDLDFSLNDIFPHFSFSAHFENVLNQKIYHGGIYEQLGIYTATIPQPGFTFSFGAKFEFGK